MQKALLNALVMPNATLAKLQNDGQLTRVLALTEEFKTFPFGAVWDEYCERCGVVCGAEWFDEVEKYEKTVLAKR